MGLISKSADVILCAKNISYYENLGYIIPRYENQGKMIVKKGTTITIKTNDLLPGSSVRVEIKCDCCNKEYKIPFKDFSRYNREGKYYCNKCANKLVIHRERTNYSKQNRTYKNQDKRGSKKYTEFIKRVLARDNYTCQCCNKNKDFEVHHLNGYNWFIEGRTDETNAITLCKNCHENFHIKYGRGNNTKEQFNEWLGKSIGELEKYNGILPNARKIFDYEENKIYDSATDYANKVKKDTSYIYNCCNHTVVTKQYVDKNGVTKTRKYISRSINGHHIFWLDEYEKMSQEELHSFLKGDKDKAIICITTGAIFEKMKCGAEKYNLKDISGISANCVGRYKYSGKLPDGTPLVWMYYEDYMNKSREKEAV